MKNKVVVFDIDGTLTDSNHRAHILDGLDNIAADYPKETLKGNKELKAKVDELKSNIWRDFNLASKNDPHIQKTVDILNFYKSKGYKIYAFSGRADEVRDDTVDYFKKLGIEFDLLKMRRTEQKIKSPYLKFAWINKYIVKEGLDVECVYEDDNKVIDYLTEKGFKCCHVDDIVDSKLKSKKTDRKTLKP